MSQQTPAGADATTEAPPLHLSSGNVAHDEFAEAAHEEFKARLKEEFKETELFLEQRLNYMVSSWVLFARFAA
jgi:hypothetical protein